MLWVSKLCLGYTRSKRWQALADGFNPLWIGKYLPVGNPDNGNILPCRVEVKDNLGAIGTYDIMNVQVNWNSY